MNIKLYYYNGLPQVINKNLSFVLEITGTFLQPLSLLNPVFQISGKEAQDLLTSGAVNYLEVDGKFYYLIDWQVMPNKIIEVRLHLDVLYTYRANIKDMHVMLERSSEATDEPIIDKQHPLGSKRDYEVTEFPRGFSEDEGAGTYVLITSQTGYSPV